MRSLCDNATDFRSDRPGRILEPILDLLSEIVFCRRATKLGVAKIIGMEVRLRVEL